MPAFRFFPLVLGGTVLLCAHPAAAQTLTYNLQTFDVPGAAGTLINGVNSSGQFVGEYYDSLGNTYGFLDSGGTISSLADPDTPTANPYGGLPEPPDLQFEGINASGEIAGSFLNTDGYLQSFTTTSPFMTLTPSNYPGTSGAGGAGDSDIAGINANGDTVGAYESTPPPDPVYAGYTDIGGVMQELTVPGNAETYVYGINDQGEILGETQQTSSSLYQSFLDDNGTITPITLPGVPDVLDVYAFGLNNLGEVVGSYDTSDSPTVYGFVLDNGAVTTLTVPGASATEIEGINDSGEIVGFDSNANTNAYDGFVGTLASTAPEPPAPLICALFGGCLGALLLRARRASKHAA